VRIHATLAYAVAIIFSGHASGDEPARPSPVQEQAAAKLREIIANVQANEKLYENIEISFKSSYQLSQPPSPALDLVKTGDQKTRIVLQDGMYFFRNDERQLDRAGKEQRPDTLQGFDGETTRIVEQSSIANLRKGRAVEARLFLPFCAILQGGGILFPLSSYLRDGDAKRAEKFRNYRIVVNYLGDESIDGLRCHKIRIDHWLNGWKDQSLTGADIRYLWLAPERNYFPVKETAFGRPQKVGAHPMESGHSDNFREISPGIWFPFHTTVTVYNLQESKEGQEPIVNNIRDTAIEKAELDPHYDVSFFRDIPFADGMPVYVIENDKIIRKYIQGGVRPTQPLASRSWSTILWIGLGITILAMGLLGYRLWNDSGSKVPA
jgi:hypothetical protein